MLAMDEAIAKVASATASQVTGRHLQTPCFSALTLYRDGHAGHFGVDCALSYNKQGKLEVLAGMNYRLNSRGPKIYVYEVPPDFNVKWVKVCC